MAKAKSEAKLESEFQAPLIKEIEEMFPGCVVLMNDASYIQGIPDITILYQGHWAALEVKADQYSIHQPNQDYYVDMLDDMSFAAFIYPQNKEAILHDLQLAFRPRGATRVSKR